MDSKISEKQSDKITNLKHFRKLNLLEKILFYISAFIIVLSLIINIEINSFYDYMCRSDGSIDKDSRVGILLGASVRPSGDPSPVLEDRVITAYELLTEGKISKILISGDGNSKTYDEVLAISKYLIRKGVPEKALIYDKKGIDTFESMKNAKNLFNIQKAIIISQSFHLPRAVYLARGIGLESCGISSDRREYWLKNWFREYFANVKAFINLTLYSI